MPIRAAFENHVVCVQERPRSRLRWVPAGCAVDPVTGASVYHRGGLYWVQVPRVRQEVQHVWRPNIVARQVAVTTLVPRTVQRQVPVQVCTYQPEQVCETINYQVSRLVPEQHVRQIPLTVCRPVCERVEQKVPYEVCHMVAEDRVCRVPVQTCRMVSQERVEQVPYQVCRMVAYQEAVRVPRCVERQVPVTYTRCVPRVVCCRIPLEPCEPVVVTCPGTVCGWILCGGTECRGTVCGWILRDTAGGRGPAHAGCSAADARRPAPRATTPTWRRRLGPVTSCRAPWGAKVRRHPW